MTFFIDTPLDTTLNLWEQDQTFMFLNTTPLSGLNGSLLLAFEDRQIKGKENVSIKKTYLHHLIPSVMV